MYDPQILSPVALLDMFSDALAADLTPSPQVVIALRRLNSQFAAACRRSGWNFGQDGVLLTQPPPDPPLERA